VKIYVFWSLTGIFAFYFTVITVSKS